MQPERSENAGSLDDALAAFVIVRRRLFGIAYRILASAAEAEDIVQDVWLRWQATDRSVILDAPAFLATMTTRLAINLAQSARSQHETYIGTRLPEPVDTSDHPHSGAERGEALEFAILLLLEKLSPTERAAYVLREAFDYPYQQIADMLKLTVANTRQLVSRARKHISNGRRATVSAAEQRRLLVAFIDAAQKGDAAALEELFATEIVSYSDGGGVVRAARVPVSGRKGVCEVHRRGDCFALLDRCDMGMDRSQWPASCAHFPQWGSRIPRDHKRHNPRHQPDRVGDEAEQAHSSFTFVATLSRAKGARDSRLIPTWLSH